MAVSITFISSNNGSVASNSITFSAQSIGTAATNRYVAVMVTGVAAGVVTAVTVGGSSCIAAVSTNSSRVAASLWVTTYPFPSGTTANIVLTTAQTSGTVDIGVFTVLGNDTSVVPSTSTFTATNASATNLSGSLTTNSGGQSICGAVWGSATPTTVTWTNATVSYNTQAGSTNPMLGSGSLITASGTVTVTSSDGGTAATCVMVGATFVSTVPPVSHDSEEAMVGTNTYYRPALVAY